MSKKHKPITPEDLGLSEKEMETLSRGANHLFRDPDPDEEEAEPTTVKGALEDFAVESRERAGKGKVAKEGKGIEI